MTTKMLSQLVTLTTAIAIGRGPWRKSSDPIIRGIGPLLNGNK